MTEIQKGANVKEIIEKLEQAAKSKSQKPQIQAWPKQRIRHDGDTEVAEI